MSNATLELAAPARNRLNGNSHPAIDRAAVDVASVKARSAAKRLAQRPSGQPTKNDANKSTARRPVPMFAAGKDNLKAWCYVYIFAAATLSAYLNGFANSEHAAEGTKWAAWAIGACIPALVLILFRVAGIVAKRARQTQDKYLIVLGRAAMLIASTMLFLSVWHRSVSLSALTGSPLYLSIAFAVGIDAGLVTSELASLLK